MVSAASSHVEEAWLEGNFKVATAVPSKNRPKTERTRRADRYLRLTPIQTVYIPARPDPTLHAHYHAGLALDCGLSRAGCRDARSETGRAGVCQTLQG